MSTKVIKSMEFPYFSFNGTIEKRPVRIVSKSFLLGKDYCFEEYQNGNFVTIEYFKSYEEALEYWNVIQHVPYIFEKANYFKHWGLDNPHRNLLLAHQCVKFVDWKYWKFTSNKCLLTYYFFIDSFNNAKELKELIDSKTPIPSWLTNDRDEYYLAFEFSGTQFQEFEKCSIFQHKYGKSPKKLEEINTPKKFEELICSCIASTLRYPKLYHIHSLKNWITDYR